jgi:4-amino-4-deoxy-L-arabinose transferase-like glycosyltransferase
MNCVLQRGNKKIFWWGMYVFSALAVLAKGIPGLVLPFATVFVAYLLIGKIKEFFNPKYILPGILLFLAVALPWHLAMFKMHDPLFFNEYIVKHHLARFVNSEGLGRKQPWFFYILVFLGGFIPWMPSFVAMIVSKTKDLIKNFNKNFLSEFKWDELNSAQKFGLLNLLAFIIIFVFFSAASTKLPTYILPAFFPAAFLLADFWCGFMFEDKNKKPIAVSMWILNSIFIIASVVAFFSFLFLPTQIVFDIQQIKPFVIALFFVVPLFGLIALKRNKRVQAFASYVIFRYFCP